MPLSSPAFPLVFPVYSDGQHINRQEKRWRDVMDDAFAHSGQESFFIRDEVRERKIAAWFLQPKKKDAESFVAWQISCIKEMGLLQSKAEKIEEMEPPVLTPLDLLKAIVKKCSVCKKRSWNMGSMRVFPEPSTPMKW